MHDQGGHDPPDDAPVAAGAGLGRPGALVIGFAAGGLNGLLGIGGGIVMVPALLLRGGLSPPSAVGTSLATMVVLSACAFTVHVSVTGYTLSVAGSTLLIVAGALGAQAGGAVLRRVSARAMLLIFATVVVLTAGKLIAQAFGAGGLESTDVAPATPMWAYPALGLVAGFLSGLVGIGGGGLVLLGLATFFQVPVQLALPVALAVNVTNALSGCWSQARAGLVRWDEVRGLVPGALAGIGAGAALAIWLSADALRVVLGVFFLYSSVGLVRRAVASR
jgi:uncharacterized membrane protein YfcA